MKRSEPSASAPSASYRSLDALPRPAAQRVSTRRLRPMPQPSSCSPCMNAPWRTDASGSSAASCSFDDLVGAGEQRWRNFEAEGLGSFQVDDEFEFRRLFYGHF
jgi:hypothetical protein